MTPTRSFAAVREVLVDLAREWREDRVTGLSAEVAFFGMLSVFPSLLALAAALGSMDSLFGGDLAAQAEAQVVELLRRVLTDEADNTIIAVQSLFVETSPGVLTVGLVLALWAASRGFAAVISALDVAYDLEERRSWVRQRALALLLALGTVVVMTLLLAMVVVGPLLGGGREIADTIGLGGAFATLWDWVRWPTVAVGAIGWAATIYHVAPNHHTPWRWDLPGAVLAATTWLIASVSFSIYLSLAGSSNQVFGTLGGGLIALMWLYLLALGLLLGAELNAVLLQRFSQQRVDQGLDPRPPRRHPRLGQRSRAGQAMSTTRP